MIPKIIHYCWFGRNEKPIFAKKCIDSWRKYCKGYQIIEWNEDNFDVGSAPQYVVEAYQTKKYAFVSDYVRLKALIEYGGIYLDTDVEVLKSFDDLLEKSAFIGFESSSWIATCTIGCEKGDALLTEIMQHYKQAVFIENGKTSTVTNVALFTDYFKVHGLKLNNEVQEVKSFTVFPNDRFCPNLGGTNTLPLSSNTYSIHYYIGSWLDKRPGRFEQWVKTHAKNPLVRFTRHFLSFIFRDHYGNVVSLLKKC